MHVCTHIHTKHKYTQKKVNKTKNKQTNIQIHEPLFSIN